MDIHDLVDVEELIRTRTQRAINLDEHIHRLGCVWFTTHNISRCSALKARMHPECCGAFRVGPVPLPAVRTCPLRASGFALAFEDTGGDLKRTTREDRTRLEAESPNVVKLRRR
jgi:hypothetical protein